MRRREAVVILAIVLVLLIVGLFLSTREGARPEEPPATSSMSGMEGETGAKKWAEKEKRQDGGDPGEGETREDGQESEGGEDPEDGEEREGQHPTGPGPTEEPPSERPGEELREDPPGFFGVFTGRVVDEETGEPIPGARIYYGPFPDWWGAHAGEDGAFRFVLPDRRFDPDRSFRLAVSAPGYARFDGIPRQGELEVALRPAPGPPAFGRIRGRAEDSLGRPRTGVVGVVVGDESANRRWLTVLADDHGGFRLEGVEPGGAWLSLVGGERQNVYLPGGGEVDVVLRGGNPAGEASSGETPDEPLPRFPIVVTGLAGRDGFLLTAEYRRAARTERWQTVVREGKARFPALLAGEWTLLLTGPGTSLEGVIEVPSSPGASFPFLPK